MRQITEITAAVGFLRVDDGRLFWVEPDDVLSVADRPGDPDADVSAEEARLIILDGLAAPPDVREINDVRDIGQELNDVPGRDAEGQAAPREAGHV